MTLNMELGDKSYPIYVEPGCSARVGELFRLDRKVLVVTDENVPSAAVSAVMGCCGDPTPVILPPGEENKNFGTLEKLCRIMLEKGFTRSDAVLALGGGVVGDLAGLAASLFMRGIDFYNVPTTLLAQVDSSIGGKTAVDLDGVKNAVGAFHQPRGVAVDPLLLRSLPPRQISNGLAEAIKMAATMDENLFVLMEREAPENILQEIIEGSLRLKKAVVEKDEKESGLRKVLNFGHTVGHCIEALGGRYHGECVALGMLYMCAADVRPRLKRLLKKSGLPTEAQLDCDEVLRVLRHDKKARGDRIDYVWMDRIGSYSFRSASMDDFSRMLREEMQ